VAPSDGHCRTVKRVDAGLRMASGIVLQLGKLFIRTGDLSSKSVICS
jgi:hypothetical protein